MNLPKPASLHLVRAPKRVKPTTPKLRGITISPAKNGAVVSHEFHGARPKQFVFHDPAKMTQHLNRALRTEWLHPNVQTEAAKIDRDIDVG
jgi:hypothetical protein